MEIAAFWMERYMLDKLEHVEVIGYAVAGCMWDSMWRLDIDMLGYMWSTLLFLDKVVCHRKHMADRETANSDQCVMI